MWKGLFVCKKSKDVEAFNTHLLKMKNKIVSENLQ